MTETKMATWWTPLGWHRAPEPLAYRALVNEDSGSMMKSWDAELEGIGYYKLGETENKEISSDFMLTHYRHRGDDTTPAHMLVEMWDHCDALSQIWVSHEHADAYWFDKYPDLVAKQRQAEHAREHTRFVKAQIAFIRHGHGTRTIDSYGDRTLDEVEREREAQAYAARAKRQAAQ